MARIDPYSQVVLTGLRESTDNDSAVTLQQLNNIPGSGTGPGVTSVRVSEDAFEGNATVTILDPIATAGNPAELSITVDISPSTGEGALKLYQVLTGGTPPPTALPSQGVAVNIQDGLVLNINGHSLSLPDDTVATATIVTSTSVSFTLDSATIGSDFSALGNSGSLTGLTHVGLADHIITGEVTLTGTGNIDISASGNTINLDGNHRVPNFDTATTYQKGDVVRAGPNDDILFIYSATAASTTTEPLIVIDPADLIVLSTSLPRTRFTAAPSADNADLVIAFSSGNYQAPVANHMYRFAFAISSPPTLVFEVTFEAGDVVENTTDNTWTISGPDRTNGIPGDYTYTSNVGTPTSQSLSSVEAFDATHVNWRRVAGGVSAVSTLTRGDTVPTTASFDGDLFILTTPDGDNRPGLYIYDEGVGSTNSNAGWYPYSIENGTSLPSGKSDGDAFHLLRDDGTTPAGIYFRHNNEWVDLYQDTSFVQVDAANIPLTLASTNTIATNNGIRFNAPNQLVFNFANNEDAYTFYTHFPTDKYSELTEEFTLTFQPLTGGITTPVNLTIPRGSFISRVLQGRADQTDIAINYVAVPSDAATNANSVDITQIQSYVQDIFDNNIPDALKVPAANSQDQFAISGTIELKGDWELEAGENITLSVQPGTHTVNISSSDTAVPTTIPTGTALPVTTQAQEVFYLHDPDDPTRLIPYRGTNVAQGLYISNGNFYELVAAGTFVDFVNLTGQQRRVFTGGDLVRNGNNYYIATDNQFVSYDVNSISSSTTPEIVLDAQVVLEAGNRILVSGVTGNTTPNGTYTVTSATINTVSNTTTVLTTGVDTSTVPTGTAFFTNATGLILDGVIQSEFDPTGRAIQISDNFTDLSDVSFTTTTPADRLGLWDGDSLEPITFTDLSHHVSIDSAGDEYIGYYTRNGNTRYFKPIDGAGSNAVVNTADTTTSLGSTDVAGGSFAGVVRDALRRQGATLDGTVITDLVRYFLNDPDDPVQDPNRPFFVTRFSFTDNVGNTEYQTFNLLGLLNDPNMSKLVNPNEHLFVISDIIQLAGPPGQLDTFVNVNMLVQPVRYADNEHAFFSAGDDFLRVPFQGPDDATRTVSFEMRWRILAAWEAGDDATTTVSNYSRERVDNIVNVNNISSIFDQTIGAFRFAEELGSDGQAHYDVDLLSAALPGGGIVGLMDLFLGTDETADQPQQFRGRIGTNTGTTDLNQTSGVQLEANDSVIMVAFRDEEEATEALFRMGLTDTNGTRTLTGTETQDVTFGSLQTETLTANPGAITGVTLQISRGSTLTAQNYSRNTIAFVLSGGDRTLREIEAVRIFNAFSGGSATVTASVISNLTRIPLYEIMHFNATRATTLESYYQTYSRKGFRYFWYPNREIGGTWQNYIGEGEPFVNEWRETLLG